MSLLILIDASLKYTVHPFPPKHVAKTERPWTKIQENKGTIRNSPLGAIEQIFLATCFHLQRWQAMPNTLRDIKLLHVFMSSSVAASHICVYKGYWTRNQSFTNRMFWKCLLVAIVLKTCSCGVVGMVFLAGFGGVSFLCFAFALHFSMFIPLLIRIGTLICTWRPPQENKGKCNKNISTRVSTSARSLFWKSSSPNLISKISYNVGRRRHSNARGEGDIEWHVLLFPSGTGSQICISTIMYTFLLASQPKFVTYNSDTPFSVLSYPDYYENMLAYCAKNSLFECFSFVCFLFTVHFLYVRYLADSHW